MAVVVLNNRYRVIRELGQGGFGRTFLAVDTHLPSERPCVIKQLYPIVSKPKQYQWVRERFQREAALLETLSRGSSQIPQLYAYFAEAETFYLVQEYIKGVTLTEKVEQNGVLSEQEVTQILVSLLPVLDYVHRQHIIHRDVKPDNIILRAHDNQPVLIDFGIVKEALETVMDSDRTHSIAIGTPGYMPSEQAAGRPVYSSDLYSLGLTAVFLLSGKAPHTLESDSRTGELLWQKAVPKLKGNLAAVIDCAVRFHPRDRFANAREMLSALTSHSVEFLPQPTRETTHLQNSMTQEATVAAVPARSSLKSRNGNSFLVGSAIAMLVILSAGVVGYGMVQVLQSLRENSNQETVVNEPSSPESETSPTQEEPTETSPPKQPEKESPQSQEEKSNEAASPQVEPEPPAIDLELDSPVVVVPTVPAEESSPQRNLKQVPIFSTGVKGTQVIETLGEPTSISRGYWDNTQSVLYKDYVSGKLDLGFLFDRDTNHLRQTEASFADAVELSTLESTLQQMLQGQMTPAIRQALAQVYRRETDLRSFSLNNWEGVIQRKEGGRIYIGVWEEDLH